MSLVVSAHPSQAAAPAELRARTFEPDTVVIYDLDGDELARATETFSRTPTIVLVDMRQSGLAMAALRAGARGILANDVTARELVAAVDAAAQGHTIMSPELAAQLLPPEPPPLDEPLTMREREILAFLARGVSNREIAAGLKISEHTVKFHVGSILAKLGAGSRTEAVTIGIRRGLIMI